MSKALLVMDVQEGVVERYAADGGLVHRLGRAISAARQAAVPVIYVRVAFRPGFPEVTRLRIVPSPRPRRPMGEV